jgi:hypothetical protein
VVYPFIKGLCYILHAHLNRPRYGNLNEQKQTDHQDTKHCCLSVFESADRFAKDSGKVSAN